VSRHFHYTTEPKGTVFDPVQDRMLDYMNVHDIK
jgi:hypothetical protein